MNRFQYLIKISAVLGPALVYEQAVHRDQGWLCLWNSQHNTVGMVNNLQLCTGTKTQPLAYLFGQDDPAGLVDGDSHNYMVWHTSFAMAINLYDSGTRTAYFALFINSLSS